MLWRLSQHSALPTRLGHFRSILDHKCRIICRTGDDTLAMETYLAVLDYITIGKPAYKIGILLERLRSGFGIQQYARV